MKNITKLLSLCSIALMTGASLQFVAPLHAQDLPADPSAEQIQSDLKRNYARKYRGSNITEMQSAGEGIILEKKNAKGKTVQLKRKFPFNVTANKGKKQFQYEIGVNYKLVKNKWVFSELGVGAAKEIAGAGQQAPAKADVKQMFAEAVSAKFFKSQPVDGVLLTDPEFAGGAYRYNAEFKVGGAQTCTDWDFILRQDGGSWKVSDIMRGRCN